MSGAHSIGGISNTNPTEAEKWYVVDLNDPPIDTKKSDGQAQTSSVKAQPEQQKSWDKVLGKIGWGLAGVGGLLLAGMGAVGSVLTLPAAIILVPIAIKGAVLVIEGAATSDISEGPGREKELARRQTLGNVGMVMTGTYGLTLASFLGAMVAFQKVRE